MRLGGLLRAGMDEFDIKHVPLGNIAEYQLALIVQSLCDEEGNAIFTDAEVDEWSAEKIQATCAALDDLNKSGEEALVDTVKNSDATASGA
jgi:hypothetical protein